MTNSQKTLKINIPKDWNELASWQLQRIAVLLHTYTPAESIKYDIEIFKVLMNVKKQISAEYRKAQLILNDVPISELKKHYAWLYEKNTRTIFLETVKPGLKKYYGPMKGLFNLTAEEFAVTEEIHERWYRTKEIEALQYLAAVLYTGEAFIYNKKKEVRPPFQYFMLNKKALLFKNIPLQQLLAIAVAYQGSKNQILTRFDKAFAGSGSAGAGNTQENAKGFHKVILAMAGGKFGNHSSTLQTPLYTFLQEMQETIIRAKELKAAGNG